jgi:hypothetical protein
MNPLMTNIWNHPRTSAAGLLIAVVSIGGVLSQQGITLGHAGTGTVVTLVTAIASALLGLLARDPNQAPGQASASPSQHLSHNNEGEGGPSPSPVALKVVQWMTETMRKYRINSDEFSRSSGCKPMADNDMSKL